MELSNLIGKYEVDDIEKCLVLNFLGRNNISISKNKDIETYLKGFVPSDSLKQDVEMLKHSTLAELSVDMETLIPFEDRETNGAFFTHQYIVDFIIESIDPKISDRVIDISCGCGAFLLGIIRFFSKKYNLSVADIIKSNLFGIDILGYNVRRSKLLIMLYGLTKDECISFDTINIIEDNSLTHKWDSKFDVVVGNPPYVKFQDMKDDTRLILDNKFETTSFGTYNLYFAFFEIGLSILKPNGLLGYITPNNYFTSLAGESLRKFFAGKRCVKSIVDFNFKKVFEVQTYTAITFLSNSVNPFIDYTRIENSQTPQQFLLDFSFTPNKYEDLDVKKWRLLCNNERDLISKIESVGEPIGHLLNIAVGIATLKDEAFFVKPYREDDNYYYCSNKYCKDFVVEKEITRPHVKISKIKERADLKNNISRIIFPYIEGKKTATPIEETVFKEKYPKCYEYLLSVKDVLDSRGKGKHVYTPFYVYGRTQGLNKAGLSKIYTPTFSQYPRFIFDENPNSLFTNGYGIFVEDIKCANFFSNLITKKENVDVLVKILNSGLMHYYVSKTSVAIEGGYPCYQKNFIEKFTIPTLSQDDINKIRVLSDKDKIDDYLLNLYQINRPAPNLWL